MAKLWENTEALEAVLETLQNKATGTGELRLDFNNSMASAISSYTFADCEELGIVAFPKCVNVGSYAFNNCSNLTSATFAQGIINEYAFSNCENLQTFTMLSAHYGVSGRICANAFTGCSNLQKVELFPNTKVTLEDAGAFGSHIPEIWVSNKAYAAYQEDTTWGYLRTNIQVLPSTLSEEAELISEEEPVSE
jgi:hypothetical protein